MQRSNDQPEEEECSICLDDLRKYGSTKFIRVSCCGKGIHDKCYANIFKSMQKGQCIICRTVNPESEEEQTERIRRWAEKGKGWAQSLLGDRYRDGLGVDQSYQQARERYESATSQGFARAQYKLGNMYQLGQGVDQSYERAAEYYEAAAKQGVALRSTVWVFSITTVKV